MIWLIQVLCKSDQYCLASCQPPTLTARTNLFVEFMCPNDVFSLFFSFVSEVTEKPECNCSSSLNVQPAQCNTPPSSGEPCPALAAAYANCANTCLCFTYAIVFYAVIGWPLGSKGDLYTVLQASVRDWLTLRTRLFSKHQINRPDNTTDKNFNEFQMFSLQCFHWLGMKQEY